jgi:nucleoid-associated protein YgaU
MEPHDDLAGLVQPRAAAGSAAAASTKPAADGYPPSTLTGRRPSVSSTRSGGETIPGPSWERMRRYEAYPEIKTRSGVPGLPRFAVLVGALAVAALALFMLPALLGFGGGGTSGSSPSPSAPRPSASVGPTVRPEPTPLVYVIKQGDNLLKVAKKFNVTLEDLLAANKDTITNPDKIAIGDQIIIPTPPPGAGGASRAPSASASTSP